MKSLAPYPVWIDFLLSCSATSLAVYSSWASVQGNSFGQIMVATCIALSLVALLLQSKLPKAFVARAGGPFYALTLVVALFLARTINGQLPNEGYPMQAFMAAVMTFMLIGGCLTAWTDGSLCFQVVPGIAIFGLVGAFDTFEPAPFVFFLFVLLSASLFFRSHARSMLAQAELAAAGSRQESVNGRELAQRAISTGAWRWMAGPEWALASALVIVLLSFLGAPVLRKSVKAVTGEQRLVNIASPTRPISSGSDYQVRNDVPIGGGPVAQSERPVLKITSDNPTYLRSLTLDQFTGSGWVNSFGNPSRVRNWESAYEQFPMPDRAAKPFRVDILDGSHNRAYVPGDLESLDKAEEFGTVFPDRSVALYARKRSYQGFASEPNSPTPASRAFARSTRLTRTFFTVGSVRIEEWARNQVSETQNDYAKARTLERAIGEMCKYNLSAKPVPRSENAAEYFLFESKEGYCDLFATSMALSARSLGMPARVAIGFLVRDRKLDEAGRYTVKENDYHMWAEIYFQGSGWVAFDPTAYAEVVPTEANEGRTFPWQEGIGWVLASAILLPLGIGLIWKGIARRPPPKAKPQRDAAESVAMSFQRELRRTTGKPRRISETLPEYLDRLESDLAGEHHHRAGEIAEKLEAMLYASELPADADIKALQQDIRAFRKELSRS